MKKIISIITLLIIVLSSTTIFGATTSKLTLELVEDKVCTILLDESGKLEKRLISLSDDKKEVVLQITVENTRNVETEILPSEIFLVIDNSLSMKQEIEDDITREEAVVVAAKTLAEKLLTVQPSTKIGVVSFSSLDSSKGETEGTINDAKLQLLPTSTLSEITTAIDNIAYTGPRTNIEAGLTVAQNNFSSDENNKAVILLTDGVPNNAVGGPTLIYSSVVAKKTSAKLKELDNAGIKVISVMTGVSDTDAPYDEVSVPEGEEVKTYKELAEDVFGTEKHPYVGSFYFISDEQINTTITRTVFNDIIITKENSIDNVDVYDYFPDDILSNYDIEIIDGPNIGKIDYMPGDTLSTLDGNSVSKYIKWYIGKLNPGEIAKIQYKLKLKENFDRRIIDVVMPTNEKVDVSFVDIDGTPKKVSSPDSPTIVLKQYVTDIPEPDPDPQPKPEEPEPELPKVIPQTGSNSGFILGFIGISLAGAVISYIVYVKKYRF